MAQMPCAYCHRVPRSRLFTLIWAWHTTEGRVAIKTRSCQACLTQASEALGEQLQEEGDYITLPTSCPTCSEPLTDGEADLTYLTFWDGDGEHRLTYGHCGACATERHGTLRQSGEVMADRPLQRVRRGP